MKDSLLSEVAWRPVLQPACLLKIQVLVGKHFFHYSKENLGTHFLKDTNTGVLHGCSYRNSVSEIVYF